jgi:hypothetical protein
MNATNEITSIGHLAGELQTPVSRIAAVAAALGIMPTSIINGVRYFAIGDVARIAEHLRSGETRPEMETR